MSRAIGGVVSHRVKLGLEVFLASVSNELLGSRIGLLCNQASVNGGLELAVDLFANRFGTRLTAVFTPQHGLWGEQQANMIETPHAVHPRLGLPIYSLYSETRQPTAEMLESIDVLVVDLQDVGTRVYTFIWTLLACLKACEAAGKQVIVLDRPNPVGGLVSEGPMLEVGFESFVGNSAIPLRHGLTICELARLFQSRHAPGVDLTCMPMAGWSRDNYFCDTGLPWIWPSPNMQRFETALVYPGQVLLEGTNLSEGRGTTLSFEVVGAPFLDPWELCALVERDQHPGVAVRPTYFRPTFDKWQNQTCGGLQIHVLNHRELRSVELTLSLIRAAKQLAPEHFQWLEPPYEYEMNLPPIDILFGSSALREALEALPNGSWEGSELELLSRLGMDGWEGERERVLMY